MVLQISFFIYIHTALLCLMFVPCIRCLPNYSLSYRIDSYIALCRYYEQYHFRHHAYTGGAKDADGLILFKVATSPAHVLHPVFDTSLTTRTVVAFSTAFYLQFVWTEPQRQLHVHEKGTLLWILYLICRDPNAHMNERIIGRCNTPRT